MDEVKLASGANHRIRFQVNTAPEVAAELCGSQRPLRGAFSLTGDPVVGTTG